MTAALPRPCSHEHLTARGLRFQLYRWPGSGTPLVLLHGWGDSGATFQFVVEHLARDRACLAPDFRGFGCTQWVAGGYWFPDYLADLEAWLDQLGLHEAVDLVGHSMGANVAMLYAGARPERVRRLVNLEGFGLSTTPAADAPARYRQWLDELGGRPPSFAKHDDWERFEWFLSKRNPRTPKERIAFIARAWGRETADGRIELRADPQHRRINPILYRREEAAACWRAIAARVLLVRGDRSWPATPQAGLEFEQLRAALRDARVEVVAGAGHMLHHEAPERIAQLIETFLAE